MSKGHIGRAVCDTPNCGEIVHGRGLCNTHYRRAQRAGTLPSLPTDEDRFGLLVGEGAATDGCWLWRGDCFDSGYGKFWTAGKSVKAHRFAWASANGRIAPSVTVDHLCHDPSVCPPGPDCPHRRCCNPAHMALVPIAVNVLRGGGPSAVNARKTHCKRGHLFDEANTRYTAKGGRACRRCARDTMRLRRAAS